MIWLASYPRSGNTFFRNILFDVYGITSFDMHDDLKGAFEGDLAAFSFVKTHLPFQQIPAEHRQQPSIYILRDGRDAITSWGHFNKDFVSPHIGFLQQLSEIIIAAEGSNFGGWSANALQWILQADVVIRYEDLVQDPIGQVEKIRKLYDLPPPRAENLPTFSKLKQSGTPYGLGDRTKNDPSKFFRKGKIGGWKDELPPEMEALFWSHHGDIMEALGYRKDGSIVTEAEFYERVERLRNEHRQERPPVKVLLEAQKLSDPQRDGINRYVYALCNAMRYLQKERSEFRHVHVDLLVGGAIVPLHQDLKVSSNELKGAQSPDWVAVSKNTFKKLLPGFIYRPLRRLYLESPARLLLEKQRLLMRLIREYKNLKSSRRFFAQYDLIHITLPQHYQYFRLLQHNFVVTVHDLTHKLFPEFHLKSNVRNAERGIDFIKKKNAAVIAVSEATKADLIKLENIENQRVKVILEAADRERFNRIYDENTAMDVLKKYGLEGQVYFFSLATLEPRKNLRNTLRAFLKLKEKYPGNPVKFALAGKTGWKEKPDYPDHPDILPLGYVNDEDLSALFTAALGFCYVSHYEGFGLPLLEAMRCGLPVIYGDNSSMIEIAAGAGLPADAADPDSIFLQMEKLLNDADLRAELSAKSFRRALDFSWEKAARETFELYQSVAENAAKSG